MSSYQQYLKDKEKRDEIVAERQSLYNMLPTEVVRELETREDQDTKLRRRKKSRQKASDVLLVLEENGVEVTEALYDKVMGVYL